MMSSVALQLILTQLGFPHNHSVSNLVKTLILKKVKIFLHLHVLDIPHLTHLLYMYPLAKCDGYRSCGNGNFISIINYYMNTSESWTHSFNPPYLEISQIRNTDLQFRSLRKVSTREEKAIARRYVLHAKPIKVLWSKETKGFYSNVFCSIQNFIAVCFASIK